MKDIHEFCPLWGEWEAEEKIGEGSFGSVWKMKRNDVGGKVYYAAVKYISIPKDESEIRNLIGEGVFSDEGSAMHYYGHMLQSISDEIDAMHKLRGYTNIVAYEDHKILPKEGGIGYDLFLRMELLTPLTERIGKGMSTQDVVALGKDIATAISVLSDHRMIHRDIKPQNIFVNDMGVYKLGDYGTARALGTSATAMSRKGTYSYMSPEIYGNRKADIRADIYSLGLVLYRLLNGNRLPFLPLNERITSEDSDNAVLRRVSGEQIPPPRYADEELAGIVLKACAFSPEDRYASAEEMIAALDGYRRKGEDLLRGEEEDRTIYDSYEFKFGSTGSSAHGSSDPGAGKEPEKERIPEPEAEGGDESEATVAFRENNAGDSPQQKEGRPRRRASRDNSGESSTKKEQRIQSADPDSGKDEKPKAAPAQEKRTQVRQSDAGQKKEPPQNRIRLIILAAVLGIAILAGVIFGSGILRPTPPAVPTETQTETPATKSEEPRAETSAPTETAAPTATQTAEPTETQTETPATESEEPRAETSAPTETAAPTATQTAAPTATPTDTPTATPTPTDTPTPAPASDSDEAGQADGWLCTACNALNPYSDRYCENCGQTQICYECGEIIPKADRFCTNCATEAGKWKCSNCDTVNDIGNSFCENCAAQRHAPKSAAAFGAAAAPFSNVGGYVTFGSYEQDNNTANGKEPIEWLVLDYDEANHRTLLLSRYGLDIKPFNTKPVEVTWEKCTLRTWLNGEFMGSAFSTSEQRAILTTAVDNSRSQGHSGWTTDGGNDTQDQIFLLSYAEANRYLGVTWEDTNNINARIKPTAYALQAGAWISDSEKTEDGSEAGWWWLRSPGFRQDLAAYVLHYGSLDSCIVDIDNGCIRPALWINLESDIF